MKYLGEQNIKLDDIEFGDRIRDVDANWLEPLVESMDVNGLQNAIQIHQIGRAHV